MLSVKLKIETFILKNIIISLVFISIALFSNKSFSQTSSLKLGCFGGTNVIGNKAGKLNKSGLDFGFALLLSNKSPLEIQMNFGLSKKRLLASSLEFNNNTLDGYFNYYPTYWSYEIPLLFKYNFTKVKKVLP